MQACNNRERSKENQGERNIQRRIGRQDKDSGPLSPLRGPDKSPPAGEGSSGGHGHKQGLGTDLEEGNNGFPGGSVVKNSPANAGDSGSIPGSGRYPGEGNGNPLQYSCLRYPMDRRASVGSQKSRTRLSD